MHWYGGSMAEAVTLSKQRNAIFVVFVEDDNQLSKELAATIDDGAVIKRLGNQNNFLAVKLKSGSENYTFFAQIYQFVPIPSLFFIGRNGTPLEVVCAGVKAEQLAERIDRILKEHRKEHSPSIVQPSTSTSNIKNETSNFMETEVSALTAQSAPAKSDVVKSQEPIEPNEAEVSPNEPKSNLNVPEIDTKITPQEEETETSSGPAPKIQKTEHHEVTKSGQEYDVVCDGDVCVRRPRIDQAGPSQRSEPGTIDSTPNIDSENTASADDKVERAKELLVARRREKEEQEKEAEKQKELERRAVGQGVAELRKWQADQELKQIQEERKRAKMENNLARQRILEQIAQDRAERKAREQPAPAPAPVPPPSVGDSSGRARVQFKLPNGAAHTAHFEVSATLADVQRYVADNLQMSRSSFSLWTAFPRLELTETDATLLELRLAPSAALLVIPRRIETVVAAPSMFSSIINCLLAHFIGNLIMGDPKSEDFGLRSIIGFDAFFTQLFTSMILDPSYQLYNWIRARLFPAPSNRPPTPTTPTPANPTAGLRRRGNIHRVTADRPDDDDNNTWNGNSTQQM